jgi:hypothetical protein
MPVTALADVPIYTTAVHKVTFSTDIWNNTLNKVVAHCTIATALMR